MLAVSPIPLALPLNVRPNPMNMRSPQIFFPPPRFCVSVHALPVSSSFPGPPSTPTFHLPETSYEIATHPRREPTRFNRDIPTSSSPLRFSVCLSFIFLSQEKRLTPFSSPPSPLFLCLIINRCRPTNPSARSKSWLRSSARTARFLTGSACAPTTKLGTMPSADSGAAPSLASKFMFRLLGLIFSSLGLTGRS